MLFHAAFVAFAVLGSLWVLLYPPAWLWHLPVLLWALTIELMQWPCPLTVWENALRRKADMPTYMTGFVEHYLLLPVLGSKPHPSLELLLTISVVAVNIGVYLFLLFR